ncbi:hypothetical protein VTG60DRAFT_1803 [Thermothelomyces hinnuleus]
MPLQRARGRGYLARRPLLSLSAQSLRSRPILPPAALPTPIRRLTSNAKQWEQVMLKWRRPPVFFFQQFSKGDPSAHPLAHRALGGTHHAQVYHRCRQSGAASLVNTLTIPSSVLHSSSVRNPTLPKAVATYRSLPHTGNNGYRVLCIRGLRRCLAGYPRPAVSGPSCSPCSSLTHLPTRT